MDLEEQLFSLLRSIIKNMRKVLEKEISVYRIGHAEMRLLMMLYSMGNCRQEELTSKIEVDRSNVGRSLKKLEQLGYLKREKDSEDTRSFKVFLTEKGLSIKEPLLVIKSNIEKTIAMRTDEAELKTLLKSLKVLDTSMSEENYSYIKSSM